LNFFGVFAINSVFFIAFLMVAAYLAHHVPFVDIEFFDKETDLKSVSLELIANGLD
jgi:hypothetical protein